MPGTGPLGCVPAELATQSTDGECAEEPQQAARIYNPQLIQMIKDLNQKLGSDVFVAANSMKMHTNFISNPQSFGESLFGPTAVWFSDSKNNFQNADGYNRLGRPIVDCFVAHLTRFRLRVTT